MSERPWLLAIDLQRVFADPSSEWMAPRYAEVEHHVVRLAAAFGDRSVFTRFVAPRQPEGAWVGYYATFPWALARPDDPLFRFTEAVMPQVTRTIAATTFGKWTPQLRAIVGDRPRLVVAGVATDCCVLSTVLAAADAGASVTVVTDACAGSSDENHDKALDLMGLYQPLTSFATTDEVLAQLSTPP
jgi:nicotinamidase-related amidase